MVASFDLVAEASIGALAFVVHAVEYRNSCVDVVVDAGVVLAGCGPVKATCVLRDRAFPGDRQCEHERVESRMVEAFAEVAARRDDRGWLVARGEVCERSASMGG